MIVDLPEPPSRHVELVLSHQFQATPEQLWPWFSDAEHLSAWSEVQIRPMTAGPSGRFDEAGATREVLIPAGPFRVRAEEVVVVSDAPDRFVYHVYKGGGLRYHLGTIELAPNDGGTHLSWRVRMTPWLPGTGPLMLAMLRPQFEAGFVELERLIALDEAAPE